jgi:hypothetical protein
MQLRYGKKQLQTLVDTSLSENWLASNSKKCPSCSAAIEVVQSTLSKLIPGVLVLNEQFITNSDYVLSVSPRILIWYIYFAYTH